MAKFRKTQELYEECRERGWHTDSGMTVTRDRYGFTTIMKVCSHCEVPYTERKVRGWNGRKR